MISTWKLPRLLTPTTLSRSRREIPSLRLPRGIIDLYRATRDKTTNTIINTTAGYLDLSQLYGSDETTAASLRRPDGTLKTSYNGTALPLRIVNGSILYSGDPRVMENPELTAVTILFMREHNFWVRILKNQHPNWSGDQLYNMAKEINTAEYQNIVYKEFLPALIGQRSWEPTAAMTRASTRRQPRSFPPPLSASATPRSPTPRKESIITGMSSLAEPLAEAFFNTAADDVTPPHGIDSLLRSLGVDFSQATDLYAIGALRNLLVAGLVGGGVDRIDLIAIDIQRQRDVGLGSLTRRAERWE